MTQAPPPPTPQWRSPEALRLSFDQYQRYSSAAQVVDGLFGTRPYTMLEVGGAPGFPELFFSPEHLAVTDRFGRHEGNFIVADGAKLPFEDQSVDVVLTLDTLEHIVAEDRPAFLTECRRVSRDVVVVTAPHDTPYVVEAELALQAFVTARFGETFETLAEHSDRGLPLAAQTQEHLSGDGWSCVVAPSGYLPRWIMGMVVHHELLAVGLPELPELHAFYNLLAAPFDNAEPAYRRLALSSRLRGEDELQAAVAPLLSTAPPGRMETVTSAIAGRLLAERVGLGSADQVRRARSYDALAQEVNQLRTANTDLQVALAVREAALTSREAELTRVLRREAELSQAELTRSETTEPVPTVATPAPDRVQQARALARRARNRIVGERS